NPYIVSSLQPNWYRSAGVAQILATVSQKQINEIAALFDAHPFGPRNVRLCLLSLDLTSRGSLFIAVLQRRHAIAVERHVGINGIRVEALAHHQHRLPMLVSAFAQERDFGRHR